MTQLLNHVTRNVLLFQVLYDMTMLYQSRCYILWHGSSVLSPEVFLKSNKGQIACLVHDGRSDIRHWAITENLTQQTKQY